MKNIKMFFTGVMLITLVSMFNLHPVYAASYWAYVEASFNVNAGETISEGDTVYIKDADGEAYKADSNGSSTYPCVGLAQHSASDGVSLNIVTRGLLAGQSSLTEGANVYLSSTAGGLSQTATAAYPQVLGYAISTTMYKIEVTPYTTSHGAVAATTGDFTGAVGVDGNFDVNTTSFSVAAATGNTVCSGTLRAGGAVTHDSTTEMTGDVTVNTDKVTITAASGNTSIDGTLGVTGNTTLNSTTLSYGTFQNDVTVGGTLGVTGNTTLNSTTLSYTTIENDTTVAGTLGVTGNTTLNSTTLSYGTFQNDVTVGGTLGVTGNTTLNTTSISYGTVDNTLTITGDYTAGGGQYMILEFADNNLASNQTAVAMNRSGSSTVTEIEIPWAGSIVGISVTTNESRTAGTMTVDATINGSVTGLQAGLNAANPDHHSASQAKDTDSFSAGDRIGVKYTTTSTWTPVTADYSVVVFIESGGAT